MIAIIFYHEPSLVFWMFT